MKKKVKREITDKDKKVLELISKGLSSKDIAKEFGNSKRTIDGIRYVLLNKTGAKNNAQLLMVACKNKWIDCCC